MSARSQLKINRRAVMLTWSQVGDEHDARELSAEAVDRVDSIFPDCHFSVGCEQHEDLGWHVHLGLLRKESGQVKIGQRLDINGHLVNIKPHGIRRGDLESVLTYPLKEDDIGWGNWDDLDSLLGPEKVAPAAAAERRDQAFAEALQAADYDSAMLCIREGAPAEYVLNQDRIARFFQEFFMPVFEHKYDVSSFNTPIIDFAGLDARESLVLIGPPALGKTHFALAHFQQPLFVNHIDKIKLFNHAVHDGIVFDDVSFMMWPPQALIGLFDREMPRDIQIRYKIVTIPAGTKKIFCANSIDAFRPKDISDIPQDTIDALLSRQHIVHVTQRLF
jgi:hypothetical protein